jgi:hypothetical protein
MVPMRSYIRDELMAVLTMKHRMHHFRVSQGIQAHYSELEKKLKKMPNCKLNSNFDWMKVKIGS